MYEPITLKVGGDYSGRTCRYKTIRFTGRLLQISESRYATTSLYKWLERGYLSQFALAMSRW